MLGLAGEALTGKTVTADALSPQVRFNAPSDGIWWEHLFFAMPLYEMAAIRQKTAGQDYFDRCLYGIHSVLTDVWESPLYGGPPYDELVEMVYDIASYSVPPDGEKPRSFLQWVGTDVCRAHDPDCWIKWMKKKIAKEYSIWLQGQPEDNDERHFGVVISDVRFPNEAEMIKSHPRGILIRLTADPEARAVRMKKRDGKEMSAEQQSHQSEAAVNSIPTELFDAIIDTSDIDVATQVSLVRSVVEKFI